MSSTPHPERPGDSRAGSGGPWADRGVDRGADTRAGSGADASAASGARRTDNGPRTDEGRRPGQGRRPAEGARNGSGTSSASGAAASGQASAKGTKARQGKDPAKPQDWGLFRTVVALYGLLIIAYGVSQIFLGSASLPGEDKGSSATVASAYGALAAVLCGVGAAFVTIAIKFKWANVLWFVCLTIFLGGIGRILAWAIFGLPHALMIVMMVLDLVIPPCLLVWHAWIVKANRIRSQMAGSAGETPRQTAPPRGKRGRKRI